MSTRAPIDVTVTLDDGRALGVRVWPGRGTPLVLLHGLLDSSAGWDELARASERPCYAIDLPGFGRSHLPSRPRFSAYADDVVQVLTSLGVRDCTLVGHSLGGGVAAAVAERDPDRVASLVLSAPTGFGALRLAELGSLPVIRHCAVAVLPRLLRNGPALNAGYHAFVTTPAGPGPADELKERLQTESHRVGPGLDAALKALAAAARSPRAFHRRRLGYRGPVSVLWGDRDGLVPVAHADAVKASLPAAVLHIWQGMGHHPQREQPRRLAAFIEAAAAAAAPAPLAERLAA